MDTNQNKHVDDEKINIIDSNKREIDYIDNEIILKKQSLVSCDDLEQIYVESNKSINEAALLINKAYGAGGNKKINSIVDESNSKLPKLLFELDEKRISIKNELNGLYDKKDEYLSNIKKEYNNENEENNESVESNIDNEENDDVIKNYIKNNS